MLTACFLVISGLLLLVAGGEVLLRGAVSLAQLLKLTPAVIGLTVVAAATSVPELAVSAVAAFQGKTDITVGNVVGSNIFNIAFILGGLAIYRPLVLQGQSLKYEYPVLLGISFLYVLFAWNGSIGRMDALIFLALYAAFTSFMVRVARTTVSSPENQEFQGEVSELQGKSPPALQKTVALIAAGVVLLALGAHITVSGAVTIGEFLGMSEWVIGLTIIAGGTGLPEVVTSVVSSYRGRDDVAIANVIGSNIFNILVILGLPALLSPLEVSPAILSGDNLWMLGVTALLLPILFSGKIISKKEGQVLFTIYVVYILQLLFV